MVCAKCRNSIDLVAENPQEEQSARIDLNFSRRSNLWGKGTFDFCGRCAAEIVLFLEKFANVSNVDGEYSLPDIILVNNIVIPERILNIEKLSI